MCGICGVVRFDGKPLAGATREALQQIVHRGPDHVEAWNYAGTKVSIELGAARLAILDPREAANQPFHRGGRFHLIYNGELYNFRELRAELAALGEVFDTSGDTEVVLAACARWGIDALARLDGMWALAFFDSVSQSGFLARDPIGIKPLMYAVAENEIAFASEMRGLCRLGSWPKNVDNSAVVQHLVFGYIADPATIYQAARRLPPGHVLAFGPAGVSEPRPYHDLLSAHSPPGNSNESAESSRVLDYASARTRLRRLIGEAVARQRVSDVPIGAFLSGGVDSSIVVHHLSQCIPGPVHTFSVGYSDARSYDESRYARLVADRLGTRHEEIMLCERDVLEAIPRILDHLDEPVGDSSIVPTSLVSRAARQFVTVALSGDGGDELFAGYWRYLAHQTLESYLRIPGLLRRGAIQPLVSALAVSRSSALGNRARQFRKLLRADSTDALARHLAWSRILPEEAANLFLDPSLIEHCVRSMLVRAASLRERAANFSWRGRSNSDLSIGSHRGHKEDHNKSLNAVFQLDLSCQLPADMLHKVDLASMLHSLEVRVPLLDRAVVEALLPMPACWKIHRGLRKRILLDAYRGHLPDEILDRPKQGFEVPIGEMLRGPLRELFHDTVRQGVIESLGLLSYPAVQTIYDAHCARRADFADALWAILSLCWWRQRN